jgi:hypothetical protein
MTESDSDAIAALSQLLTHEIDAIRRGDLDLVNALAARKTELAQAVEAAAPAIEAALTAEPDDPALRTRIAVLHDLIETDRTLLDSIMQTTGAVIAEIVRIRERHGLGGLYGEKGQTRPLPPMPTERLDRSV